MIVAMLFQVALAAEPSSRFLEAGEAVTVTPEVPSWLVPESAVDACLVLDGENQVLERGLADCTGHAAIALQAANGSLSICAARLEQGDVDLTRCQASEIQLGAQVQRFKRQRDGARIVAGVLAAVVGFAGVVVVAL